MEQHLVQWVIYILWTVACLVQYSRINLDECPSEEKLEKQIRKGNPWAVITVLLVLGSAQSAAMSVSLFLSR